MPQSPSKQAPWDVTQFPQTPSAVLSYFPETHGWSEISSLSKVVLVLGKARSCRCQIWAVGGLSLLGILITHQNTLHKMWCVSGCIVMMKLPITICPELGLPNHPNSFCRGMFKFKAKFDADSLLYWPSHLECDGHTVHMLTYHVSCRDFL